MKLQLFDSKIDFFDVTHWSDKIHSSDFGLIVFMQNLKSLSKRWCASYRKNIADFPALAQRGANAQENKAINCTISK